MAFGKPLAERDTILADIAQSRMEIDQARLLTLKAAHLMDTEGNKVQTHWHVIQGVELMIKGAHAWLLYTLTESISLFKAHVILTSIIL